MEKIKKNKSKYNIETEEQLLGGCKRCKEIGVDVICPRGGCEAENIGKEVTVTYTIIDDDIDLKDYQD